MRENLPLVIRVAAALINPISWNDIKSLRIEVLRKLSENPFVRLPRCSNKARAVEVPEWTFSFPNRELTAFFAREVARLGGLAPFGLSSFAIVVGISPERD